MPTLRLTGTDLSIADVLAVARRRTPVALDRQAERRMSESAKVVAELSRTLMNKFLHDPTVRLRAAAANGRGLGVVDTARYLFGLERAGGAGSASAAPAANTEDPSTKE